MSGLVTVYSIPYGERSFLPALDVESLGAQEGSELETMVGSVTDKGAFDGGSVNVGSGIDVGEELLGDRERPSLLPEPRFGLELPGDRERPSLLHEPRLGLEVRDCD